MNKTEKCEGASKGNVNGNRVKKANTLHNLNWERQQAHNLPLAGLWTLLAFCSFVLVCVGVATCFHCEATERMQQAPHKSFETISIGQQVASVTPFRTAFLLPPTKARLARVNSAMRPERGANLNDASKRGHQASCQLCQGRGVNPNA